MYEYDELINNEKKVLLWKKSKIFAQKKEDCMVKKGQFECLITGTF